MWTFKLAKIHYSTAHKKYEHWWQESCTVLNVCGINVLFYLSFPFISLSECTITLHLHVKFSKIFLWGRECPQTPLKGLLSELSPFWPLVSLQVWFIRCYFCSSPRCSTRCETSSWERRVSPQDTHRKRPLIRIWHRHIQPKCIPWWERD